MRTRNWLASLQCLRHKTKVERDIHTSTSTRMATLRKLTDTEVRAIFESLHGDSQPPPHLKFKIVRCQAHCQKLSPPSYEFEGKHEEGYRNLKFTVLSCTAIYFSKSKSCYCRWPIRFAKTGEKKGASVASSFTS